MDSDRRRFMKLGLGIGTGALILGPNCAKGPDSVSGPEGIPDSFEWDSYYDKILIKLNPNKLDGSLSLSKLAGFETRTVQLPADNPPKAVCALPFNRASHWKEISSGSGVWDELVVGIHDKMPERFGEGHENDFLYLVLRNSNSRSYWQIAGVSIREFQLSPQIVGLEWYLRQGYRYHPVCQTKINWT